MMSIIAKPLCISPAWISGTSCSLSPEKLRAMKVPPSESAARHGSTGACWFSSPFFDFVPMSADAENWPLVSP